MGTVEQLERVLSAVFSLAWSGTEPSALIAIVGLAGVVGVATYVLTIAARYVIALAGLYTQARASDRSIEPADLSELLSQSDPDADGHARPRAPTCVAGVA